MYVNSAKEAWTILVKSYRRAEDVRREKLQEFWKQYELAQMKSTESVKDYFARIVEMFNGLRSNGEILEEVKVVKKILESLSSKFHTKMIVLEATQDLNSLRLDDLEDELVTYEMSLNQKRVEIVEEALQIKQSMISQKKKKNH